MKNLILIILLFGASLASGVSDYHTLYLLPSKPVIVPPTRIEINMQMFINHLGLIESSNDWKVINCIGCMGKYQFAEKTLEELGYYGITPDKFRQDPNIFPESMQEQALQDLIKHNQNSLRKFASYIGQVVNGVLITEAGLLGAAHLAGIGGIQKFLTSNHNATDINGSSVQKYLNEFRNYNV